MSLPNGMIAIFSNGTNHIDIPKPEGGIDTVRTPPSGLRIYADINGLNKPNMMGKDIFDFMIYLEEENKLTMWGQLKIFTGLSGEAYTKTNFEQAFASNEYWRGPRSQSEIERMCREYASECGAWIMRNGWKIPKKYPWL